MIAGTSPPLEGCVCLCVLKHCSTMYVIFNVHANEHMLFLYSTFY